MGITCSDLEAIHTYIHRYDISMAEAEIPACPPMTNLIFSLESWYKSRTIKPLTAIKIGADIMVSTLVKGTSKIANFPQFIWLL